MSKFEDYLNAKFSLDSRSLNTDVLNALDTVLSINKTFRWLDLGTGNGAMLRRLIERFNGNNLHITGFDIDESLLNTALKTIKTHLNKSGYHIEQQDESLVATRREKMIRVDFCQGSITELKESFSAAQFDLITAHAVMDLVPLPTAVQQIHHCLSKNGCFYTSLNYDGETCLFPEYPDRAFETKVLTHYNQSMENRRINTQQSGGTRSGRRLHSALTDYGFGIAALGSSDWNMTPLLGKYRNQDSSCIESMLYWIAKEASHNLEIEPDKLRQWRQQRAQLLDANILGIIVHQIDLLAQKNR